MLKFVKVAALALPLLAVSGGVWGEDKKPVTALPPHPLDGAFEKATTAKGIDEGLLNNPHFKNAVAAALKAKQDQEKEYREKKNLASSSPAQAARNAFLRALAGEESVGEKR